MSASYPFTREEYQRRVDAARARMAERGIDVLLCTNPANMAYLTGYDGWSFYVHQLVVLAMEGEPVWVGRGMDANAAKVTTWLEHGNIHGYPDDYVQSTLKHPMDYVADLLSLRGWDRGTSVLEMDSYYFTAACRAALERGLPEATFADTTTLVGWVRVIKSADEIAYMRQAARIIEKTMQVGLDMVRPGVRQCDAAAAIWQSLVSGTEDFGGDYPAICPMLPTGIGTSTPHLTWTDRPFVEGEATILELAGTRLRYHCPMARTVHLGRPPERLVDTAKIVVEGLGNAIEAARPGAECQDVEAAWRRTIERHGIVKESRIGYSTGLSYPPDWGEHTLSLRPGDHTVLEPDMTLHIIPGVWLDDWGIEISECVHITASGAEPFCSFPRKLFVN